MPKLVATKEIFYAGKTRNAGDEFDASDKDAKVLKAIGKATDPAPKRRKVADEPVAVPRPAPVQPKVELPPAQTEETQPPPVEDEPPLRRRYYRRDLRPEE